MKKKITKNIGIKVLSLLLAILTWYIIITFIDPTTSRVIDGVKVSIKNDSAIKDYCYSVLENEIISVTVKGKKSVVDKVKVDDIQASADLGKMMFTYSVPIDIKFTDEKFDDLQIVKGDNEVMKVKLEKEIEQKYDIVTEIKGKAPDDYYVGKSEITREKGKESVYVKGPVNVINKIARVEVRVDVSDVRGKVEKQQDILAVDEDGEILDPSKQQLTFSYNKIKVTINPLLEKEVDVKVKVSGEPASGYGYKATECDVSTIKVAGNESTMSAFNSVQIVVDIEDKDENVEKKQKIRELISDNVKLTSDDDVVNVKVIIEKLATKKIEIMSKEIEVINKENGEKVEFPQNKVLKFELKGLSEKLKTVYSDSISPYIDASKLENGSQEVSVSLQNISDVKVVEEPNIEVEVTGK